MRRLSPCVISLATMAICAFGVSANAELIAYYSFDSDYSLTAGSYTGTLSETENLGATVAISSVGDAKFGTGAADFTSTTSNEAYLALSEAIDFGATEAWSVSFWQRRRAESDDRVAMVLGDRSDASDFIWVSNGQLDGLRFRNSSGANFDFGATVNNDYVHWVVVADGTGNVNMFRNGVADDQNPRTGASTFTINTIGQAYNNDTYSMSGQIDELYIFDEAIDAAKIAELYSGGPDETAPTLTSNNIVDNRGGGPVTVDSSVTYTLTFSEDMDAASISSSDFGNAGDATYSIGTITETMPGVFSVEVTPNSVGTLRLQINKDAILSDASGNNLDTSTAILDDTTITVELTDSTPPTLTSSDFSDDQNGGPVTTGTTVIFTISFSEDMNESTADAADFGNVGTAAITIGAITETSPGVFTVAITPTSAGTLQLQIKADATLTDAAGNPLDASGGITSEVTISVEEVFDPLTVKQLQVFLLGGQSNADGRAALSELPTSPVNLQEPQEDVDFYEGSLTTLRPYSEFGPEVTLGRRLADNLGKEPGTRVAIIKYGAGGTSLYSDWAPGGDATTSGDGSNYVTFQNRVTAGLAALASAYPNAVIEIKGMLWVQGERDAQTSTEYANYETNLTAFIADIRLTYGYSLWFIVSRLSNGQTSIGATALESVRAAQSAVAAADPLTALLDTDGFGMKSDNLHFDGLGQQQLGDGAAGWLLDFSPFLIQPKFQKQDDGSYKIVVERPFDGFDYTLQTSTTLESDSWQDVESVSAGSSVEYNLSLPGIRRFYRVARQLTP